MKNDQLPKSEYHSFSDPQQNRFEGKVADYMKQFTRFLHMFFCLAIVITVLMTLYVFFVDIYAVFLTGNIMNGSIHALGTLLILWTLTELLNSEIRSLRGEKIQVTIFIEVAIAAFVRKLLVLTTEGLSLETGILFLSSLLVLGIVYYLLTIKSNNYAQ